MIEAMKEEGFDLSADRLNRSSHAPAKATGSLEEKLTDPLGQYQTKIIRFLNGLS